MSAFLRCAGPSNTVSPCASCLKPPSEILSFSLTLQMLLIRIAVVRVAFVGGDNGAAAACGPPWTSRPASSTARPEDPGPWSGSCLFGRTQGIFCSLRNSIPAKRLQLHARTGRGYARRCVYTTQYPGVFPMTLVYVVLVAARLTPTLSCARSLPSPAWSSSCCG